MLPQRPSAKLRSALSLGGGFAVARSLFRGISFTDITKWAIRKFGQLTGSDLDHLISHGAEMHRAGQMLQGLSPGAHLSLSDVPVNPWLSSGILEGSRAVSEIILPWQIQSTGQSGEWFHRIRFFDAISIDELSDDVASWVAQHTPDYVPPALERWLDQQFDVGGFVGVSLVRGF